MVKPTVDTSKADILQAQINVSISQARDLVSSWLPTPTPTSTNSTTTPTSTLTTSTSSDDDLALFKALPPRLGLGAPIPQHFYDDDSKLRRDISSTDLLRRKMLGPASKRHSPHHNLTDPKTPQSSPSAARPSRPHQQTRKARAGSESEEDTGRSALGKSKRQKTGRRSHAEEGEGEVVVGAGGVDEMGLEDHTKTTPNVPQKEVSGEDMDGIVGKEEMVNNDAPPVVANTDQDLRHPQPQTPPVGAGDGANASKKKKKKKKKRLPQDNP